MTEPVHGVSMPETAKMIAAKEQSQIIGEFLEWLDGRGLLIAEPSNHETRPWQPHRETVEQILAAYFDVDLKKVEQEKVALLEVLRKEHDVRTESS